MWKWFLMMFFWAHASWASTKGNGGDTCERRIQVIKEDIEQWIHRGGPQHLDFPKAISRDTYEREMLMHLESAKFFCTSQRVFVGSAEKTCINSKKLSDLIRFLPLEARRNLQRDRQPKTSGWIVCNFNRFNQTDESEQYVLTHHEYAGLSGFETNDDERSNYKTLSNQLTGFLETTTIKRLAIKPVVRPSISLKMGKYKKFGSKGSCQIHAEVQSEKLLLTEISNQQTGRYCPNSHQTYMYTCKERVCTHDDGQLNDIRIIDQKSFLYRGSRYLFFSDKPVQPARIFTFSRSQGLTGTAKSFTGKNRCAFFTAKGYVWCDDRQYAEDVFCPQALSLAKQAAIDTCERVRGQKCQISQIKGKKITERQREVDYKENSFQTIYSAMLFCEDTATATPVDE